MIMNFLCENSTKWEDLKIFTIIGICFCIVVTAVALVWLTCFMVRLLIKTFKVQVANSYDVFVESNNAKTKSRKERNAINQKLKDEQKMEILNLKLHSKTKIYEMKKQKLAEKLQQQENKAKEKYFPETVEQPVEPEVETKLEPQPVEPEEKTAEKPAVSKKEKENKEDKE